MLPDRAERFRAAFWGIRADAERRDAARRDREQYEAIERAEADLRKQDAERR